MANLTRIRPEGMWVNGSVVDAAEFEALDAMRPLLINATDGSTHAPTAPIIIGGSGLRMTGPTDIDGDVDQDAGSVWSMNGETRFLDNSLLDMRVDSTQVFRLGSLLQFNQGAEAQIAGDFAFSSTGTISGTARLAPGASLSVDNTAKIELLGGGSFVMGLGSTGTINGLVTWGTGLWPLVSSRTVTRNGWRLAAVSYDGTAPANVTAWLSFAESANQATIETKVETTTAHKLLVELTDLPIGSLLGTVTVRSRGIFGGVPGTIFPKYQIVRWRSNNSLASLSTETDDAHDNGDWTAAKDTVLTANANQTILEGYHYGVIVQGPYLSGTGAAVRLYDFESSLTQTKIQGR